RCGLIEHKRGAGPALQAVESARDCDALRLPTREPGTACTQFVVEPEAAEANTFERPCDERAIRLRIAEGHVHRERPLHQPGLLAAPSDCRASSNHSGDRL